MARVVHYTAHACRLVDPNATKPVLDPAAFAIPGRVTWEQVGEYRLDRAWAGCKHSLRAGALLTIDASASTCRSGCGAYWGGRDADATARVDAEREIALAVWDACCRHRGAPRPVADDLAQIRRAAMMRSLMNGQCGLWWANFAERFEQLSRDDQLVALPLLELYQARLDEHEAHRVELDRIDRLAQAEFDVLVGETVGDDVRAARGRRVVREMSTR